MTYQITAAKTQNVKGDYLYPLDAPGVASRWVPRNNVYYCLDYLDNLKLAVRAANHICCPRAMRLGTQLSFRRIIYYFPLETRYE